MQRLCKNCNSFPRFATGVCKCAFLGIDVDPTSAPPPDKNCWSKRRKLTPEELSRVRSAAGRKGGSRSGYGQGRMPTQQTSLRKMDHDVLANYAQTKNISMAEAVHRICKTLVAKYPNLKTEYWRD